MTPRKADTELFLRIPAPLKRRIAAAARRDGRSMNNWVERKIEEVLEREEEKR